MVYAIYVSSAILTLERFGVPRTENVTQVD